MTRDIVSMAMGHESQSLASAAPGFQSDETEAAFIVALAERFGCDDDAQLAIASILLEAM